MPSFLMWLAAGVFLAVALLGVTMQWRTGETDWRVVLVFSALAAMAFLIRAWPTVRREQRRRDRHFLELRDALQRLVDDMARLSLPDLSIYIDAGRHGGNDVSFCTSRGSANHNVLLQMNLLGLAAPEDWHASGTSSGIGLARYKLTPLGRAKLAWLLDVVAKRHRHFAG